MDLAQICTKIRENFDSKNLAREKGLSFSRQAIRASSNAIRAIHRGEFSEAEELLAEVKEALDKAENLLKEHKDIYYAGFFQDAQKEYAEARITLALIHGGSLPDPDEIGVGYPQFLNGLGEAIGELRRHILDIIREANLKRGEELLKVMDDLYYALVSFDYPEAITRGLRRTADIAQSIIQKTRGDLTTALRQSELQKSIARLEEGLKKK